jgi:hypothetical protein
VKKHVTALCKVEVTQSIKFCNVLLGFKISRDHLTERFSQSGNNIIYFLLFYITNGGQAELLALSYFKKACIYKKARAYPSGAPSGDPVHGVEDLSAYFALPSVTKKKVL